MSERVSMDIFSCLFITVTSLSTCNNIRSNICLWFTINNRHQSESYRTQRKNKLAHRYLSYRYIHTSMQTHIYKNMFISVFICIHIFMCTQAPTLHSFINECHQSQNCVKRKIEVYEKVCNKNLVIQVINPSSQNWQSTIKTWKRFQMIERTRLLNNPFFSFFTQVGEGRTYKVSKRWKESEPIGEWNEWEYKWTMKEKYIWCVPKDLPSNFFSDSGILITDKRECFLPLSHTHLHRLYTWEIWRW